MEIRQLDRRITLQSVTASIGSEGSPVKTWSDTATVWASVQQDHGSESIQHDQVNANANFTFQIRYTTEYTPDRSMRVVYNSTNLNISDFQEIPRRRGWIIFARVDAT